MRNWREVWREANGAIPKGMHIHHIEPRYLGGSDDLENLQLVTPEEHYDIHFERGEYTACALLADGIDREAPKIAVVQFSLDGYRIDRFESFVAVGNYINKKSAQANVNRCCRYKKKSVYGYQWFYESEVRDKEFVEPVKRIRPNGGHDSTKQPVIISGIKYKSKADAAKKLFPKYAGRSDGGQLRKEFVKLLKLCV